MQLIQLRSCKASHAHILQQEELRDTETKKLKQQLKVQSPALLLHVDSSGKSP